MDPSNGQMTSCALEAQEPFHAEVKTESFEVEEWRLDTLINTECMKVENVTSDSSLNQVHADEKHQQNDHSLIKTEPMEKELQQPPPPIKKQVTKKRSSYVKRMMPEEMLSVSDMYRVIINGQSPNFGTLRTSPHNQWLHNAILFCPQCLGCFQIGAEEMHYLLKHILRFHRDVLQDVFQAVFMEYRSVFMEMKKKVREADCKRYKESLRKHAQRGFY